MAFGRIGTNSPSTAVGVIGGKITGYIVGTILIARQDDSPVVHVVVEDPSAGRALRLIADGKANHPAAENLKKALRGRPLIIGR